MSSSQGCQRARPASLKAGGDGVVVDPVQLQREEKQVRGCRRQLLLHVAVELGALRIGGVARIDEAGIGGDAAKQILDRLIFGDGAGRARRRPGSQACRKPTLVAVLEGLAVGSAPVRGRRRRPANRCPDRGPRTSIPATARGPRPRSGSGAGGHGIGHDISMSRRPRGSRTIAVSGASFNPGKIDQEAWSANVVKQPFTFSPSMRRNGTGARRTVPRQGMQDERNHPDRRR